MKYPNLKGIRLAATITAKLSPTAPFVLGGDLGGSIKKAKDLGYQAIELQYPDATKIDTDELKAHLQSTGLHVSAVATGGAYVIDRLSLTDDDKSIRDAAIRRVCGCIDVAHKFSAVLIIGCVRGNVPAGADIEVYLARLAESLGILTGYGQAKNVPLVLEAINRYENNFLNNAKSVSDFIKAAGLKNIKLHLDTFHMNIEEPDILESLTRHMDEVAYIHIADSNRMAPGAGHIDFKKFIKTCADAGYQGYLSAECLPLPDGDTAAARWIEYFKNL